VGVETLPRVGVALYFDRCPNSGLEYLSEEKSKRLDGRGSQAASFAGQGEAIRNRNRKTAASYARFGRSEGTDPAGAFPVHPAPTPLERTTRGTVHPQAECNPCCRRERARAISHESLRRLASHVDTEAGMIGSSMLVGVDGCRGGWIAVSDWGGSLDAGVHENWLSFVGNVKPDALIAVDIPIGLPARGARACDVEARRFLGIPRGSSVFPAPVRACLATGSYETIAARHRRADGRGLSKQAFHLLPKIRQLDEYLLEHTREISRVYEIHPEVSFATWNEGRALQHSKASAAGRAEREQLIDAIWQGERERLWARVQGRGCRPDDLNDAFAALWTAVRIARGSARRRPQTMETDEHGLRMEIVA
jgi:predicted RNase H-like nuclease